MCDMERRSKLCLSTKAFGAQYSSLRLDLECTKSDTNDLSSLISAWFGRTHLTSSLSLSLQSLTKSDDIRPLRKGIFAILNRITELCIDDSCYNFAEDIFNLSNSVMSNTLLPMLETLVLGLYIEYEENSPCIDLVPRLHTVTIDIVFFYVHHI